MSNKGRFKYILACDCETSGLFFNTPTPDYDAATGDYYQAVSVGLIVVNVDTMEPVESLYVEIEHDGVSLWSDQAERVHGLSKEHLKEHGVTEEEAVIQIVELILKYWGPDSAVSLLGHNVGTFDLQYIRSMLLRHDINIKFAHRHLDTMSAMLATFGTFTSDEAFEIIGVEPRNIHNALQDAYAALQCVQTIRALWNECINLS